MATATAPVQFLRKFDRVVPEHDGSLFSWTGGEGVTEASDLGGSLPYAKVYDDAMDVGFRVRSKTGVVMDFVLSKVDYYGRGEDAEVSGWRFISPTGIKVLIIND